MCVFSVSFAKDDMTETVLVIVILPFGTEGKLRQIKAEH